MSLAEFDEINYDNSTDRLDRPSNYLLRKARKDHSNGLDNLRQSMKSATIYVGKLSFYTSEEQIYELFSKCGVIKRIIMGLDRFKFTPCGFCFVIYNKPEEALNAVKYLSDTKLDDREITIDLDPGFEDGRQFGRGKTGGQVSDELRFEFDASRGGFAVPFAERVGAPNTRFDTGQQFFTQQHQPQFNNDEGFPHQRRRNHHHQRRHFPHQQQQQQQYVPPPDAMGQFASNSGNGDASDEEDNYIPQ